MPVYVDWYDDQQKIVLYRFERRWTWDDFYPVYQRALEMERAQPHRVDVIMDFRTSKSIPPSAITHMRKITDNQPDNIGLSIFVTTNRFFNVMYETATKVYPKIADYFVIVETMDDAHATIAEARRNLVK